MGLLDASNLEASNPSADDGAEDLAVPGQTGAPDDAADEPKLSRRQEARQERESTEAWRAEQERLSRELESTRNAMREREIELARLRGTVEQIARQPAPAQHQQPAAPDPEALRREARKLLEAGDVDGYETKLLEAAEARMALKLPQPQQQQNVPPPPDPVFQAAFGAQIVQHPDLAALPGPALMQLLGTFDNIEAMREPNPVKRMPQVFARAAAAIKGEQATATAPTRPTFSRDNRSMLTGGAHVSEGGSGGDDADGLSPAEAAQARKFGLTPKQYAAAKKHTGTFG